MFCFLGVLSIQRKIFIFFQEKKALYLAGTLIAPGKGVLISIETPAQKVYPFELKIYNAGNEVFRIVFFFRL